MTDFIPVAEQSKAKFSELIQGAHSAAQNTSKRGADNSDVEDQDGNRSDGSVGWDVVQDDFMMGAR